MPNTLCTIYCNVPMIWDFLRKLLFCGPIIDQYPVSRIKKKKQGKDKPDKLHTLRNGSIFRDISRQKLQVSLV